MRKGIGLLLVFFLLVSFGIISFNSAWAEEGSWTPKAPIKTGRRGLGVAVVDGKIYAIGGQNDWINSFLDINEMYDPAKDTWTSKLRCLRPEETSP